MWKVFGVVLGLLLVVIEGHRPEVVGYWENWVDVNWWGNNIPGNCLMGCAQPAPFFQKTAPYSSVNYGFTFLTQNPNPDQISCSNSSANCPVWDGHGIYIAHASQSGATVITANTDVHSIEQSPGLIGMGEVCRLAHQDPSGPKRCLITVGGWSDWARVDNMQNAQTLAQLISKMVLFSFADGVDLDFEHLTEFTSLSPNEVPVFISLIKNLRTQFNTIGSSWKSTAQARYNDLQAEYNAMPDWQKNQSPYYPTNMKYMQDLISNDVPYFEISWTTRFNAIINQSDPFNYLTPDSPIPPPFATRNEGKPIWDAAGANIDNINVMAYDAGSPSGPLKFNFPTILNNFKTFGPIPTEKLVIGVEPGDQAAGGVWEGLQTDIDTFKYASANGYGGAMVWAINPNSANSAKDCPIVAQNAHDIIQPQWPYGNAPTFTHADPTTGWLPGL